MDQSQIISSRTQIVSSLSFLGTQRASGEGDRLVALSELSWGKHRRRCCCCRCFCCFCCFCCLQTPGRAGCHQVDKVSHFAHRQDYSQGQRLKWLLFESQPPHHTRTHTQRERARGRESKARACALILIPFWIHCLRRDHGIKAQEHTAPITVYMLSSESLAFK